MTRRALFDTSPCLLLLGLLIGGLAAMHTLGHFGHSASVHQRAGAMAAHTVTAASIQDPHPCDTEACLHDMTLQPAEAGAWPLPLPGDSGLDLLSVCLAILCAAAAAALVLVRRSGDRTPSGASGGPSWQPRSWARPPPGLFTSRLRATVLLRT